MKKANCNVTVAIKVITLPEAKGSITLSSTFNPFLLKGKERELLFAIIDLVKKYTNAKN